MLRIKLADTYSGKGDLEGATKVLDTALVTYQTAMEKDPSKSYLSFSLGEICKTRGDLDGAMKAFKRGAQSVWFSRWRLASIYRVKGEDDEAINTLKQGIEEHPSENLWYKGLATIYYAVGLNHDAAIKAA